jgi:hypothetical protein
MSTIRFRGKDTNHISVGKDKSYDHQTVQGAVDAVVTAADSASDNPYLISVDRGYYLEKVVVAGVTDLSMLGLPGSVIARDSSLGNTPGDGGTLVIGNTTDDATQRIRLESLHVVNKQDGDNDGGPPEGAIFVGEEEDFSATGNYWNDVIISGCVIEGVHDALQIFGQERNGGANTEDPSRVWVHGNVIKCVHDAVTTKGRVRGYSSANQVYANSNGVQPYLTSISNWKTTGYHHNVTRGGGDNEGTGFWLSSADTFHVEGGGNVGADYFAGILFYAGGKVGSVPMRHRFVGTVIRVEYDADNSVVDDTLAGIRITDTADTGDDDWIVVNGADIYVHQKNTGVSATGTAAGVFMDVAGVGCDLKIFDSSIHVVNDASASNEYSLYASTAQSTIKHGSVYSDSATDNNSGTGTITQLTEL